MRNPNAPFDPVECARDLLSDPRAPKRYGIDAMTDNSTRPTPLTDQIIADLPMSIAAEGAIIYDWSKLAEHARQLEAGVRDDLLRVIETQNAKLARRDALLREALELRWLIWADHNALIERIRKELSGQNEERG